MKKFILLIVFVFSFGGDLKNCIIKNITDNDKVLLVKWGVSAYANSDKLKGFVKIDKKASKIVQQKVANLFNELLSKKCNKEFKEAFRKGNLKEIEDALFTLGKVAGVELAKDVKVEAYLLQTFQLVDLNKLMINLWGIK